jgi:hypothetical protein
MGLHSFRLYYRPLRHAGDPLGTQHESSPFIHLSVETDPGTWLDLDRLVEDRPADLGPISYRDTIEEYTILHFHPGRDPTVKTNDRPLQPAI